MVERDLAKVEVAGSSPVIRSILRGLYGAKAAAAKPMRVPSPVIRSINKREEMQISSFLFGSIAQLGEHLPYKQRVIGSSPIVSTSAKAKKAICEANETNLSVSSN